MAEQEKTQLRLEIAHVLFIDIVGYSKLLIEEQAESLEELNALVRQTDAVREAEAADKLVRLPAGDGMALVFTGSVAAPVECALQISQALRVQPSLPLRMGIHSGPVHQVEDINQRSNVAGAGINIAQRVMDCGDAGHILLSKRVADDLAQYRHWQPYLHDLGDCTVKHGAVVSLVNLYADVVGNPLPPARLHGGKAVEVPRKRFNRWPIAGAVALLLAVAALVSIGRWAPWRRPEAAKAVSAGSDLPLSLPAAAPALAIPEKSVAVLPFDNFSGDKDQGSALFADGVQDEVLTDLAKVADLKVISRSSVMQYKDTNQRNLPSISKALGVAYVVEGSVQKSGNQVRVTAQLIDARTDTHQWAEHYDRDLADVFAIESEVAERIVTSLQARLSQNEETAIKARPTSDVAAYDLYLRAKTLIDTYQETPDWRATLGQAILLLEEASKRDPDFALAYCLEAKAHDFLYSGRLDPSQERLAYEENAVSQALRLQPDLGEAHLARAMLEFHGRRDYPAARRELAIARNLLPNSAEVYSLTTWLDRREGHWADALPSQARAVSLDPRNPGVLNDEAVLYDMLHLYRDEIRVLDMAVTAAPASANYFRVIKASALLSEGETAAGREELDRLPADFDPNGSTTYVRVGAALEAGRPEDAARALAAYQGSDYSGFNGLLTPRTWLEALVARAKGDSPRERGLLLQARTITAADVSARPEDPNALALLGQIDAGLGNKDDALREGRHAVEMRPISVDAMEGPGLETDLTVICAWTGETDEAMRRLLALAKTPGGPDYGQLRFDPLWSALRDRPEYQAMLARLKPAP
jgi:TolB-like protein/class 3 adenylate cyclase